MEIKTIINNKKDLESRLHAAILILRLLQKKAELRKKILASDCVFCGLSRSATCNFCELTFCSDCKFKNCDSCNKHHFCSNEIQTCVGCSASITLSRNSNEEQINRILYDN